MQKQCMKNYVHTPTAYIGIRRISSGQVVIITCTRLVDHKCEHFKVHKVNLQSSDKLQKTKKKLHPNSAGLSQYVKVHTMAVHLKKPKQV